jgi:DNA-binding transcriptional LysR family regulator
MAFDLVDLKLFCDVVDGGSITRGAERSALALAAASTRIRNMELSLGGQLLTRARQGVTPTPAGRTLLKHARAMLAQGARMREDLAAFSGGMSGEIRLLANTNALTEFLPEVLSLFLAAHPHVSVAGTVEMGALETYPFRSDRFVVVTAADHELAARQAVGFGEVLDRDFVGLDRASSLQRFLADKAVRAGKPLRLRVQLRSFDAVCRLVECGVGIGIVPQTTAHRAAKTMALGVVALTDDWALRELRICVRALAELRPFARELVESLRA